LNQLVRRFFACIDLIDGLVSSTVEQRLCMSFVGSSTLLLGLHNSCRTPLSKTELANRGDFGEPDTDSSDELSDRLLGVIRR
jgi:hypothetical protein